MNAQRRTLLFVLLLFVPNLDARKFGGGGGGFRGSSGARANPAPSGGAPMGGGHPPMGAGGGGFHPPPAGGGMHGSNFRPAAPGHFSGAASGPGSAKSGSAFKTALAGAALGTVGGLVAFEAGKAIIHSFDKPIQHDGRNYYWGDEYVKKRPGDVQCRMPFENLLQSNPSTTTPSTNTNGSSTPIAPDQALAHATFPNGTRPKQIVWVCRANEECCGTDCCQKQNLASSASKDSSVLGTIGKVILIIIVVGFLLCCCCVLIAYKFCRSLFDSCMPSNSSDQSNKYESSTTATTAQQYPQQPQAQAYPMQPYPGSNNYPAQPPSAYPPAPAAYPPAPGYYENKY